MPSLRFGVFALSLAVIVNIVLFLYYYTYFGQSVQSVQVDSAEQCSWIEPDQPGMIEQPPWKQDTLYVAAVGYAGQQGSSALSLSSFQCFITSLHGNNAIIAEPKFKDSCFNTFIGSPMEFSSVLDLDYFNEQSRMVGYPEVSNLEEFVKHSPRYVVYVVIRGLAKGSVQQIVWQAQTDNDTVKCLELSEIQNMTKVYRNGLNQVQKSSQKCIVRVVELWATRIEFWDGKCASPVNSIRKFIFGEWSPSEAILVFSYWAFYVYPPLIVPHNRIDCIVPKQTTLSLRVQFQPSKRIIHEAMMYRDMFLGGEMKMAIMFRVERVARDARKAHRNVLSYANQCFDEASTLKRKLSMDTNALVTMDVGGKYGTSTFMSKRYGNITEVSTKVLSSLYNDKWSVQEWEESFIQAAGGVTDRGYIAALQRVLASRADCLVLVGGGDFQVMAAVDYMRYHNSSDCIHLVCVKTMNVQQAIDRFNNEN